MQPGSSFRHILLQKAHVFDIDIVDLAPQGGVYDVLVGAWLVPDSGELLINSPHRAPPTKKQDVETGEDQKGH